MSAVLRTSLPGALAMLALAGCAQGPATGDGCARQVDRDPAVQAAEMRVLGDSLGEAQFQPALVAARKRAETACLRAHGEAPAGGVEGVQHSVGRF